MEIIIEKDGRLDVHKGTAVAWIMGTPLSILSTHNLQSHALC